MRPDKIVYHNKADEVAIQYVFGTPAVVFTIEGLENNIYLYEKDLVRMLNDICYISGRKELKHEAE